MRSCYYLGGGCVPGFIASHRIVSVTNRPNSCAKAQVGSARLCLLPRLLLLFLLPAVRRLLLALVVRTWAIVLLIHLQENARVPVSRNPALPSEQPEEAQKHPHAMTEIDLDNDQKNAERGSTAATDIQLEAEQRAMQALHCTPISLPCADTKGKRSPS